MAKTVLVINSGSSSIKYQLVDLESGEGLASGLVEKIGEPVDGHYKHEYNGEKHELEEPIHDHEQGLKRVLGFFEEYGPKLSEAGIVAVGHRVVQGGSIFPNPALVTDKTINQVKDLAVLAPLHNGPEAKGAEVMRSLLPDVPQIFVFDSSFFFQLPKAASTYALNELDALFNKRSGMMGMTGYGDLREVHRLVAEGNEDAKLALDVYVHRIVSYIGNYTYQMGGCDVITFTAGVGENDDVVRKMVCDKLAPFGVKLDEAKNAVRSKEPRIISTPDSSVVIAVIPTNEELAIARKSAAIAEAGTDTYGNTFAK